MKGHITEEETGMANKPRRDVQCDERLRKWE